MNYKNILVAFIFTTFSMNTFAGIVVGGTRVIYKGNEKEASITIKNPDKTPYLIQSWLEDESNQVKENMPLTVTPPLFRLNGEESNALRIVKTDNLKQDQESVYWLNVKAIPSSKPDAKNELHISINTRIKLFYRPASLDAKKAGKAYEDLKFSVKGNKLIAHNPTPFYISIGELKFNGNVIPNAGMISPYNEIYWDVNKNKSNQNVISWSAINDYGSLTKTKEVTL